MLILTIFTLLCVDLYRFLYVDPGLKNLEIFEVQICWPKNFQVLFA